MSEKMIIVGHVSDNLTSKEGVATMNVQCSWVRLVIICRAMSLPGNDESSQVSMVID